MGKMLLKLSEKIQKEKAIKEAEKQRQIIAEIDAKERERQSKIDQVESKYASEMTMYQIACTQRGANAPAWVRLCLLAHEQNIRAYTPNEYDGLIKQFNLEPFALMLEKLCPPIKPPVKQVIDPLVEDE